MMQCKRWARGRSIGVAEARTILEGMETRLGTPEDELLAALSDMTGEDHAVSQDRAREGMRILFAYLDTLRSRLCESDARVLLKQDFERSGPALAAMLAADAYLTALGVPAQATVGALVFKLGVDRICSG